MTIDRERERAKRRHAKRQATLQSRAERQRRNQQVVGAVLAMVLVIGGVFALTRLLDDAAPATTATGGTPSASPSASPTASEAAPDAPKQFDKVPDKALSQRKVWDATLATSAGDIQLELYGDKAPQTVASFVFLTQQKWYDGTPCHRLTVGEGLKVLQCGDPTGQGTGGPGYTYEVENAPPTGSYPAGTLAMARGQATNSNGSQFFITHGDSQLPTEGGGYSIFGKVTKGLEVLRAIAAKGTAQGGQDGRPKEPVTIKTVTVEPR